MKHELIYPAGKAIITGLFAALLAVTVTYFRGDTSWALGGLIGAMVALVSWLAVILPPPKRQQLPISENSTIVEFPTTTRIEIVSSDPAGQFQAGRFADLPISREDLQRVAKRLAAGAGFGHSGLAGPGRPLSRSQFEVLRDEFISRGLAYWRDPGHHAQGCELTHAGRRVMGYFATEVVQVLPIGNSPLPQLTNGHHGDHFSPSAAHAHRRTRANGREAVLTD